MTAEIERDGQKPNNDSPQLPPGLDLLWGRRERKRHGPKPGLSLEGNRRGRYRCRRRRGVGGGVNGPGCKELGFTTMSLYRYITSKEELLQLMWNASAQGAEELVLDGEGWRPKLRGWAIVQREMLDRHPWITQMPMAAPPLAPNSLTFVEHGLATMDGTNLAEADKLRIIGLISSYTLSEARMAHDAARAAAQAREDTDAEPPPSWSFEALLRELVDEQHYPRLHRIAWSADIGSDPSGFEERQEFHFGLDRILDGVESLIERKPHRSPV